VKVTDCPDDEGFTEVVMVDVVVALFTVCVRVEDVLPDQFPPAAYVAVRLWLPTDRVVTLSVAVPAMV